MHPTSVKLHELSGVGKVFYDTENKTTPMYIDLIMPVHGDQLSLEELQDLLAQRLLPNNPRFSCRIENGSFVPTDVDLSIHVNFL